VAAAQVLGVDARVAELRPCRGAGLVPRVTARVGGSGRQRPDRHLTDRETGPHRARGGGDHPDRISPGRAGRSGQHRVRVQRSAPPGEHPLYRLHPRPKPAQPPPHRRPRPTQPRRDPPMPHTSCLRRQRRADHRGSVRPPDQQQHRQQHMGHPAARAPRPARHHPHHPSRSAHRPSPRPALTGQHTRTTHDLLPVWSPASIQTGKPLRS
jgi:hypothetical protein